jgi:hypothetical protein
MQSRVALGKYEEYASKAIMRVGPKKYAIFYYREVKKRSVWVAFVYIEEKSSSTCVGLSFFFQVCLLILDDSFMITCC